MKKNKLQVEQLSRKLEPFTSIAEVIRPSVGWVKNYS
jgi:hypothetical protein